MTLFDIVAQVLQVLFITVLFVPQSKEYIMDPLSIRVDDSPEYVYTVMGILSVYIVFAFDIRP